MNGSLANYSSDANPPAPLLLRAAPESTGGDIMCVLRQQASEHAEVIGEPRVLREMLNRLPATKWAGKAVKNADEWALNVLDDLKPGRCL